MKFKLLIVIILFFSQFALGEILDLGGSRLEVVDGTISEKDAKIIFTKCHSLYRRGKYNNVVSIMAKFIKYYKGKKLPDAYFLIAKAYYMRGNFHDTNRSYKYFLNVYDTYPNTYLIKKGIFSKTIKKAAIRFIKNLHHHNEVCEKIDPDISQISGDCSYIPQYNYNLELMIKFTALYQNVSGKKIQEVDNFLNKNYTKKIVYDSKYWLNSSTGPFRESSDYYYKFDIGGYDYSVRSIVFKTSWHTFYGQLIMGIIWGSIYHEMAYSNLYGHRTYNMYVNTSNDSTSYKTLLIGVADKFVKKIVKLDKNISSIKHYRKERKLPYYFYEYIFEYAYKRNKTIMINLGKNYKIKVKLDAMKIGAQFLNGNGLFMTKDSIIKMTITFPPLKNLIILKHGSLYDWTGLKRVNDAL